MTNHDETATTNHDNPLLKRFRQRIGLEDGEALPAKAIEIFQRELWTDQARKTLRMAAAPDFADAINPDLQDDDGPKILSGLVEYGDNVGIVAPRGSGGSTVGINLASSAILGNQFLGLYHWNIDPATVRVILINPEENKLTPYKRLRAIGLSESQFRDQVLYLYTSKKRFYFDNAEHVDRMIDAVYESGNLPNGDEDVLLIIDGFDQTAEQETWNQGIEAWKNGLGTFQAALGVDATFVRAHTTSAAGRRANKGESRPYIDDVAGGQFAKWPDVRAAYWREFDKPGKKNRQATGLRILEIEGRMHNGSTRHKIQFDETTNRLNVEDAPQSIIAEAKIARLLDGQDQLFIKAITSGAIEDPTNVSEVARWLHSNYSLNNTGVEVTFDSFRRRLRVDDLKRLCESLGIEG